SDTEVILAMYVEHGRDMLAELNGMFAFAVYDERRRELFVARDAHGIKPLYFAAGSPGFAFASELEALLALLPVARELDVPALHRYLSCLWCPGSATPLRGVARLGPGEQLVVRDGRVLLRERWARIAFGGSHDTEPASAAQGVAGALRTAVQRQLVAD